MPILYASVGLSTGPVRCLRSLLLALVAFSSVSRAAEPFMCERGEAVLHEDFDPASVSERWFFRGAFALRDGALVRTRLYAAEGNQRVFLKEASFHNVILQFKFRFEGETTDLRLVTGADGHYNSIVQIRRSYFQVNTADDKAAGIVPSHLGECAHRFEEGRWYTMTVEFFGDTLVAWIDPAHVVLGSHPLVDRTRSYLAFQFDRPSASVDEVRIWKAPGQRPGWPARRKVLAAAQAGRSAVDRDPVDRYAYTFTNLKSRLTRFDPAYAVLVASHQDLQQALHQRWPGAFRTHKELSRAIQDTRKRLKADNPEFKDMENAMHRARRAEDAYVVSVHPALKDLAKHRLLSELPILRAGLEKREDPKLAALVAESAELQRSLETRFPEAFASGENLVTQRNALRKALNEVPAFQEENRAVADAWQAIRHYELAAEPRLEALDAARRAYQEKP